VTSDKAKSSQGLKAFLLCMDEDSLASFANESMAACAPQVDRRRWEECNLEGRENIQECIPGEVSGDSHLGLSATGN